MKVMLSRLSFVTTATLEDPSHVLRLFLVERKIPLSLGHFFTDNDVDTVKEAAKAPMRNPDDTSLLHNTIKPIGLPAGS